MATVPTAAPEIPLAGEVNELADPVVWAGEDPAPDVAFDELVLAEEIALEADRLEADRLEAERLELARLAQDRVRDEQERSEILLDDPLWPFDDIDDDVVEWVGDPIVEWFGHPVVDQAEEVDEPTPTPVPVVPVVPLVPLVPLVPDEAVADLDEEPAWAAEPEPELAWAAESEPEPEPAAAAPVDEVASTWEAWRLANTASLSIPTPTGPEDLGEPEWLPAPKAAAVPRRRPLMTGDFDDDLPEDRLADDEAADPSTPTPVAEAPLRRSGRPRVPLKAHREVGTADPDRPTSMTAGDLVWVTPIGKICPPTHPVKGMLSRGIFHVVGGRFYDRTQPERCYRSDADAEAEGMRQAKR